jgi:lycopene elongase/hydratase (dihydrobisanhydrobacterioruberin-forming)
MLKKLKEIFETFRWKIFIIILLFFSLGIKFAETEIKNNIFFLVIFLVFAQYFGFAINDYFDFENDKKTKNRKKGILKRNSRKNIWEIIISGILSFILLIIIFFSFEIKLFYISLGILIILTCYSLPKYGFKRIPFLDFLSNIFLCFLVINLGFYYSGQGFYWQLYAFSLVFGIMHLLIAILDYDSDKKAGITTTPVFIGKKNTFYLIFLLSGILILLPFNLFPRVVFILLFLIIFLFYKKIKWILKRIDWIILFFILLYLIWFFL